MKCSYIFYAFPLSINITDHHTKPPTTTINTPPPKIGQFETEGGRRREGSNCILEFSGPPVGLHSGKFFSPRYPQNYPPNYHCQYIFHALRPQDRVKILFQNIQLESVNKRFVTFLPFYGSSDNKVAFLLSIKPDFLLND